MAGIGFVTAMIGLFGVSEALTQFRNAGKGSPKQNLDKIIPSWATFIKYLPLSIRSSLLGVFIGALPGTGGDVAALLAYDQAKRSVRHPSRPFGTGAYEGIGPGDGEQGRHRRGVHSYADPEFPEML